MTNKFKGFEGKTISHVEDDCVNAVTFYFTDGTFIEVYAECGTDRFSIPYFDVMKEERVNED